MPVPSKMQDLSTLAASNSPAGSDAIGNSLDDYLRAQASIIRSTNALSSASIASASTTDLGTSDGEAVTVTGTVTITSFGTSVPGLKREVTFAGALTITNSASIVLTGGANVTTVAGDIITFRSLGSGVWTQVASARLVGNVTASGGFSIVSSDATMASSVNNPAKGITVGSEVSGGSAKAAYINFIRQGVYGVNLGLDSDNQLKVGGGSLGATSSRIVSEGLTSVQLAGTLSTLGATNVTQGLTVMETATGGLAGLSVTTTSSNAFSSAFISFNRTGSFACYFGLGADNELHVGGWSRGAVSYRMVHEGLANPNLSGTVTAVNFVATSDRRKKKQIKKLAPRDRLSDLLTFCQWLWKESGEAGQGVIAQDVKKIAPEYVYKRADGTLGVDKASLALECVIGLAARVRAMEGK